MTTPFLRTEGLTKHFGPVRALTDISIDVHAGQVLALVGENGAGKSTLMRLLEGVFAPTRGRIYIDGQEMRFSQPKEAHAAGIRVIHQEPEIVPDLTVAENIFAGALPRRGRYFLDWSTLLTETTRLLKTFGMASELHPRQLCSGLGPAQRQMIEIMRAVQAGGADDCLRRAHILANRGGDAPPFQDHPAAEGRWRRHHLYLTPSTGNYRACRPRGGPSRRHLGRRPSGRGRDGTADHPHDGGPTAV
ncbi:sugar ABC transporter ATP-binding protein [Yangia mangrovi]|uniref:Sugar ABC transporter ATP-binding protein n=1 Tax=Alloyangia mangrovi TaxID=1779329 RepID=A0ABT2KKB1_9RHOB|nr:sugar ABC transporter ATP-binding protein [Alloyangia mangrovi]